MDDPRVLVTSWGALGFEENKTNDGPWLGDWRGVIRRPADRDAMAVVFDVQLREVDRWLLALALFEVGAVGERWVQKWDRTCLGCLALRACVDEGVDAFRVVCEVFGKCLVGQLVRVVADELGIVVGDLLCFGFAHALALVFPEASALLHCWSGK